MTNFIIEKTTPEIIQDWAISIIFTGGAIAMILLFIFVSYLVIDVVVDTRRSKARLKNKSKQVKT